MYKNLDRRLITLLSGTAALSVALLASTAAYAADTPLPTAADVDAASDDADAGDAIVVTAQRREEKLQDVPTAVSVLSDAQFTVAGLGRSANEVLTQVPNASAGTQQHGRPRWWIRGVGAGQQQLDLANPVGFYFDDVYISNASATGLPLFDIERVEVLRGPQGTLWGKNTTGGAINVITKRPSLSGRDDSYVKLEYGSYDNKIAEGAVNVALVPDKLALRASFRVDDRGGRFNNAFTGQKSNAINDDVFRLQLRAKPSDDLEALLSFHYRKYDTTGGYWTTASYANSGVYRGGYVPSTDTDVISLNAGEYSNSRQIGGNLHLDYHIGELTLTSITGYERFDTKGQNDSDYTPFEISRGYTDAYSSQWTQELRLTSPQTGRLTWIAGLFYFNEKIHSDAYTATLPQASVPAQQLATAPSLAYSQIDYSHKAESGAVFGSATFAITDALKLTAGARWSRETKTLDFFRNAAATGGAGASWSNLAQWWNSYTGTFGGSGVIAPTHFSPTWDAFTYDVTPSYKIDQNNLVYFKFSHGVKSGGFNTAAAASSALIVVAPEKLDAFEFGYKSTWLGGKLTLNATAFHYDYRNVQVNVVAPNFNISGNPTTSYLQNAPKAHSDGGEIELTAEPLTGLRLNGAAGILYTEFDEFQVINTGTNPAFNYAGNQFVRSPHLTLNGGVSYTFNAGDHGKVELAADARYQSRQFYYVNVQDAQDPNRSVLGTRPYTLTNARITWTAPNDKVSASVFVNNLFDVTYRNHALPAYNGAGGVAGVNNPQAASAVLGDIVQYGDPRTWGASLIYRF